MSRLASGDVSRVAAALEVILFVGSVITFIWLVDPVAGRTVHFTYYLLVLLFAWWSARNHHETPSAVGIRLDTLAGSARRVLPITAVLAAGVYGVGWLLGSLAPFRHAVFALPLSFFWAFAQQYVLQVLVQRRLWDAGVDARAPVVAALLFALAHAPNPGLMALTFAGGWMWAAFYRRCQNLLTLAFSHALLAAVVLTSLPPSFTGHLRVGPGYSKAQGSAREAPNGPRLQPGTYDRLVAIAVVGSGLQAGTTCHQAGTTSRAVSPAAGICYPSPPCPSPLIASNNPVPTLGTCASRWRAG